MSTENSGSCTIYKQFQVSLCHLMKDYQVLILIQVISFSGNFTSNQELQQMMLSSKPRNIPHVFCSRLDDTNNVTKVCALIVLPTGEVMQQHAKAGLVTMLGGGEMDICLIFQGIEMSRATRNYF